MEGQSRKKKNRMRWLLGLAGIAGILAAVIWTAGWAASDWKEKAQKAVSGSQGEAGTETASLCEETDRIAIEQETGKTEETEIPEIKNAETETEGQEAETKKNLVLAFAGDVLLSDHVLNAYQSSGGIRGVLGESLREAASGADLFMANQEFPFSSRGTAAPDKQYTFRLPPEKVSMLKEMEIDLVTLANNHALDYGTDALLDTCAVLDGAGIPYVGAGENLDRARALYEQRIGEWKVGFLGATRVIPEAGWAASGSKPGMLSTYDPTILLEETRKAKERCDYVVIYVHWGVEREEYPKDYQRQLGHQLIEAGADLVIGSHPHVLQGIEYYQGKPIVYSLGNFVFGSSIPRTVLLLAKWDGERTQLSVVPAVSSAGYTREVTDQGKRQELFSYLESISFQVQIDEEGRIFPAGDPET